MKSPSRRLGRGLGAFLDFGPADEDGAARVEGVLFSDDATSIIETSAEPAPRKHSPTAQPTPRPVTVVAPPPAAEPVAAAAPTPPVVAAETVSAPDLVFVDEFLFVDEPVVEAAPEPVAPVEPVARPAPVPPPAPASVEDDSLFVDDVVEGIAFPDVEME